MLSNKDTLLMLILISIISIIIEIYYPSRFVGSSLRVSRKGRLVKSLYRKL
jgi:hypothetical protein